MIVVPHFCAEERHHRDSASLFPRQRSQEVTLVTPLSTSSIQSSSPTSSSVVLVRSGTCTVLSRSARFPTLSYATIQGIDCLLAKFRSSVVMEETPRYRPKLCYHVDSQDLPTIGGLPDLDAIGTEVEFPPANNEHKRRRSRHDGGTIGLSPSRRGRGGYGSNYREG